MTRYLNDNKYEYVIIKIRLKSIQNRKWGHSNKFQYQKFSNLSFDVIDYICPFEITIDMVKTSYFNYKIY